MSHTIITVAADETGMYSQLQDAINSISPDNDLPVEIQLFPGIYHEKVTLDRANVSICGMGASPTDTIISYDDYALAPMPDGNKRGTFRSYTLFIDADNITLQNLTVENASGDSKTHGQAIALYAEGDRLFVDSCRLLGHQDTLFTGPLPPTEKEPGGFIGPKQFAPRINGRQCYSNCYICGDIDFIFGSATAYFEHCTIDSLCRFASDNPSEIQGYVTAASTPQGQTYGYVFSECRFVSLDCPPASVYLGRPWREYAQTVLLDCQLGSHIHPSGFHDWNKSNVHETIFYAEYNSTTVEPASNERRASFVKQLSFEESRSFLKELVLSGNDGWLPETSSVNSSIESSD